MKTLLFILLAAGAFHFIYEGILLPSLQMKLRHDLFALRDKLRRLKATKGDGRDGKVYRLLNDSLSNSVKILPYVTIDLIWRAIREIKGNSELAQTINQKIALINGAEVKEFKQINEESSKIMFYAFLWNSLPLMIYLLPIVLSGVVLLFILGILFKSLRVACKTDAEQIGGVVYLSEPEVEKMANGAMAAATA